MSRSAHAIAFGHHNVQEIAAALRATGLVEDNIKATGGNNNLVSGTLVYSRKGKPGFSTLWIFDGSIGDSLDVYSGERTLLSANFGEDDILRALLESFGGFVRPDDEEEDNWKTVEGKDVEFSAEDRVRIEIAKIVGPKQVDSIMDIATDPTKCRALIAALERFSSILSKPDLRDDPDSPRMV
jgi:hypothetical protein